MTEPVESKPQPPTWLDKIFVEKSLMKDGQKKEINVESVMVTLANKQGSGYSSQIYRITAHVRSREIDDVETKSLVVKISPDIGPIKELVDDMNAFQTESLMLYEVMPQIYKILQSVEGDKFRPFTAKCFAHGKEPTDFILLEDLVASGFRLADAGKPLDLQHCSAVLRTYGRLHAASVFLLKQQPKYKKLLAQEMFTNDNMKNQSNSILSKMLTAAANELKKYPEYEKYSEKYTRVKHEKMELMWEAMKRQKEVTKLTVLTHGDCWKNNVMFKYSGTKVDEIRLVDFQFSSTNSPVSDLTYFLYANASLEVHRDHLDTLLVEYHSTLVATLRALGMHDAADEYPLEQLNKDMDDYLIVGMRFALMSGFVITTETFGDDFVKSFFSQDNCSDPLQRTFDNPYSPSYLKYLTLVYESKGLL